MGKQGFKSPTRSEFGTKRSQVQILSPRPKYSARFSENLALFCAVCMVFPGLLGMDLRIGGKLGEGMALRARLRPQTTDKPLRLNTSAGVKC